MEALGKINNREIKYLSIRSNVDWYKQLPTVKWIVFTIADIGDEAFLNDVTMKCLDKGVLYTCSAGQLAHETESYFDQEIVWREVQIEDATGIEANYDKTPMTTSHQNFSEGFWFASVVANPTIKDEYLQVDFVVCVDFTSQGVKTYIKKLISQINSDWLPSDEEIEDPEYDR